MQTIRCTYCNKFFKITEAVASQISEEEKKLREEEIMKARLEEKQQAERRLHEELVMKEKNYENQFREDRERIERLMKNLLKANEEMRALRKKDEEREIENQRKLSQME